MAALLAGWRYLNLAVEGVPQRDVVRRASSTPRSSLRPDLVTVVCGANDVVRTTRPEIDGFAANFEAILPRLRGRVARGSS